MILTKYLTMSSSPHRASVFGAAAIAYGVYVHVFFYVRVTRQGQLFLKYKITRSNTFYPPK